jgi:glycerol uptake facilitator protein
MNIFIAEMIGTAILILLGNGVVANVVLKETKGNSSGWIVITAGWAMAVTIAVYSVGRISGAHINPAITIGLASVGALKMSLVPVYLAGQMAGAVIGAILVYLSYLPHWAATDDGAGKLACFSTGPAISCTFSNFLCEFIGTTLLMFAVLAIGANSGAIGKAGGDVAALYSTGLNPLLVGLLVFAIGLSLGGPTGYAINPARDLGPRIAHAFLPIAGKGPSDWSYAWIPVVAPILGGVAGAMLFNILPF